MLHRRQILRTLTHSAGACSLTPFLLQQQAEATAARTGVFPQRFVFVIRSNGVLTSEILPTDVEKVAERPHAQQLKTHVDASLANRQLPAGLRALEPHKAALTLIQGLSGRMMSGNHEAGFGALGACSGKMVPRRETVDWALARHLGGVVPHIGFTMEQTGKSVTYPRLSASGPNKALPYYADPLLAYTDLFGTVATGGQARTSQDMDRNMLDFMVGDVRRFQSGLSAAEKEKMDHYLHGFESLKARQSKLQRMEQQLKQAAPELTDRFHSDIEIERLKAHFDLAASSLIAGLTRVCTIRCEHLEMRLSGLGLGNRTVHHIGHMIENKADGNTGGLDFEGEAANWTEFQVREVVMNAHMEMIAGLWDKLKKVPEGDGTMADNTTIVYFSDHGDRHHSSYTLWPMTVLGHAGGALRTGRYLQYPGHKLRGNQTMGNFYLSLLHAAGDQRQQFGDPDLESPSFIDQSTPLPQWMAS